MKVAKLYETGIALYPFPEIFEELPRLSTTLIALILVGRMRGARLPARFTDLSIVEQSAFGSVVRQIESAGRIRARRTLLTRPQDRGLQLELREFAETMAPRAVTGRAGLSAGYLEGMNYRIENRAWSVRQLIETTQAIAQGCDFRSNEDLQGNGPGLRRFFAQCDVPEIWHAYLSNQRWEGDPDPVSVWCLEQEDCDFATLVLFLHRQIWDILDKLETGDHATLRLANDLMQRAGAGGFDRFKCQLPFDHAAFFGALDRQLGVLGKIAPDGWQSIARRLAARQAETRRFDIPHGLTQGGFQMLAQGIWVPEGPQAAKMLAGARRARPAFPTLHNAETDQIDKRAAWLPRSR